MRESREIAPEWVSPSLENERGEIERAIGEFLSEESTEENISRIVHMFEQASLSDLSDEEWSVLENTDSFHGVRAGHIEDAEQFNEEQNQALKPEDQRDLKALLAAFQEGASMEAPMILKHKGILHLVSGNTRLMIARALNIRPKVVIGEAD